MSNGIENQLVDSFLEDDQLMVQDGGQKVNLWQSAAKAAKDTYYQGLFSIGDLALEPLQKSIPSLQTKHNMSLGLHYLSGSGEDVSLSDNQELIDAYIDKFHQTHGNDKWTKSTNPEFHGEEGWEYLQYRADKVVNATTPKTFRGKGQGGSAGRVNPLYAELYDKLGSTSTMRRRNIGDGSYEYMIVEPWDLKKGKDVDPATWAKNQRRIPKALANIGQFLAPDFIQTAPVSERLKKKYNQQNITGTNIELTDYAYDWLKNKAKPFNISGSSIVDANLSDEETWRKRSEYYHKFYTP